jgi:hypothetical protein
MAKNVNPSLGARAHEAKAARRNESWQKENGHRTKKQKSA